MSQQISQTELAEKMTILVEQVERSFGYDNTEDALSFIDSLLMSDSPISKYSKDELGCILTVKELEEHFQSSYDELKDLFLRNLRKAIRRVEGKKLYVKELQGFATIRTKSGEEMWEYLLNNNSDQDIKNLLSDEKVLGDLEKEFPRLLKKYPYFKYKFGVTVLSLIRSIVESSL